MLPNNVSFRALPLREESAPAAACALLRYSPACFLINRRDVLGTVQTSIVVPHHQRSRFLAQTRRFGMTLSSTRTVIRIRHLRLTALLERRGAGERQRARPVLTGKHGPRLSASVLQ